jgi:hypothetical protein
MVRECRFEAGLDALTPSDIEIEYAWVMHGGIYYYGVRKLIYERTRPDNIGFVIESSLDAFLLEIARLRDGKNP